MKYKYQVAYPVRIKNENINCFYKNIKVKNYCDNCKELNGLHSMGVGWDFYEIRLYKIKVLDKTFCQNCIEKLENTDADWSLGFYSLKGG